MNEEEREERFAEIIEVAIREASGIECSLEEFVMHMRSWKGEIDTAIDASGVEQ